MEGSLWLLLCKSLSKNLRQCYNYVLHISRYMQVLYYCLVVNNPILLCSVTSGHWTYDRAVGFNSHHYTQIPLRRLSPKLPRGESRGHKSRKSRTQTIWTCRDGCVKVRDKPVCVALMEFSPLQCTGKVGDKIGDKVRGLCHGHKSRKSATQIMKVGDVICVADLHDLCPWSATRLQFCWELVPDFVAKSA